ncbi:dna-binding protein [Ophiostoma piceae UAMH 11346]|uniref:Dna-binding protein n=1 Tax=Ophiostoma piceae (strain UAMH 11346) TaxID=1262450 RepID=S3CJF6_OPHP1|nr:dna-binding protein [Ophiostoma piceae UAMH 11346]
MGRLYNIYLYFWNFRYLPMRYRLKLITLRRRILPRLPRLYLAYTLRTARTLKAPPQPPHILFLLKLLWPFPRYHYPAVLPATPRVIMAAPETVDCQIRDLMSLRMMPLWCWRDTAQRSFYRLYEAVCATNGHMTTYETEYFWHRASPAWATETLADPRIENPDIDAEQYAVMAAVVETLVLSFIWRLELGLRRDRTMVDPCKEADLPAAVRERCPAWAVSVPGLDEELLLHPENDLHFDSPFHRRNIITSTGHFYTV